MQAQTSKPLQYSDIKAKAKAENVARTILAGGGSPAEAAAQVTRAADEFFAHVCEVLVNLRAKLGQIACGPGCSSCCHQMVSVTVAEGERVADYVRALPDLQRESVLEKARHAADRGAGLDPRQWWEARIPCPLLDDQGACVAHAVRPLPCRGYSSADLQACLKMAAGEPVQPPFLSAQIGVYGHAQVGLAKALAAHGKKPPVTTLGAVLARLADQASSAALT